MANKKSEKKTPNSTVHGPDGPIDISPGNNRGPDRGDYVGPDGTRFGNEIGPSRNSNHSTGFGAWDVGDYDEFH